MYVSIYNVAFNRNLLVFNPRRYSNCKSRLVFRQTAIGRPPKPRPKYDYNTGGWKRGDRESGGRRKEKEAAGVGERRHVARGKTAACMGKRCGEVR